MEGRADKLTDRFFEYSLLIIELCKTLHYNYISKHLGNQLLRSRTSAGANYEEARGAETKKDFIYKLHLVLKELRESLYWLKLIDSSKLPDRKLDKEIKGSQELIRIICKSLLTAKMKESVKKRQKVK